MKLHFEFAVILSGAHALMYDVISPKLVPPAKCTGGCADWTSTNFSSFWMNGAVPNGAANHCAQLANATGYNHPKPVLDPTGIGGQGAWCVCAGGAAAEWGYCTSAEYIPEQINLQLAGPDTVVVSFVTFEPSAPDGLPLAMLAGKQLTGVTHTYVTPKGDRTYYMHFIKFAQLAPRTKYSYKVKSGSAAGAWSDTFEFRSPYDSSDGRPTKVAIFGDMGVYSWNNMANMQKDVEEAEIDLVVQMGDHCYNMGGEDDRRGDGYMQAYEPILTRVPWV